MTNYENQKERIDAIHDKGAAISVNKETNEVEPCGKLHCTECLFSLHYNSGVACNINEMKWLVSEYKEETK